MALSGLDIYKLLPKTNCRKCGFPTCLAFAMQLAKKAVELSKCPDITAQAKNSLEASAQPPIKLITIGEGENKLEIGNENVLFRHEEKFFHPTGIGIIIEDNLSDSDISDRISKINKLHFERIGQNISVNLIAIKQTGSDKAKFINAVTKVSQGSLLNIVLCSEDPQALKEAAIIISTRKPLIYAADKNNYKELAKIAKEFSLPLAIKAETLEKLSELSQALSAEGIDCLVLDTPEKTLNRRIWNLTQIRRLAIKKNHRPLGYPSMAIVENKSGYAETIEAAAYILKYAGIVLLNGFTPEEILPLLTLRQNIYTDPQKPLQVEPKVYEIGQVTPQSPMLITTNFSLTYYTVLGEIETSKIPTFLVSVDTEGMSVLTAWAAEKFTPEKISESLKKFEVDKKIAHKNMIIPGYVAVMSGDLEEKSGHKVIVGPREAAGIPSFLRNLK